MAFAVAPKHRCRGFTLVEILCVVFVVAMLMGILTPVIGSARQAGNQLQCASNLRQWAMAVTEYAQSNEGWLPRRGQGKMPTSTINWYDDWFNELPRYLNQQPYQALASASQLPTTRQHSVWVCPELTGASNSYGYLFGYAMNMALSLRIAPLPDSIEGVGPTSTMVFFAEGPTGYRFSRLKSSIFLTVLHCWISSRICQNTTIIP